MAQPRSPGCTPQDCDDFDEGLFRIAQEALTSVVRHAGAPEVAIRLPQVGNDCLLEVCGGDIAAWMARADEFGQPVDFRNQFRRDTAIGFP